ncbi:DUF6777 domain-containing protein [Streptomyces sp. RerS4]|uniref:DUF6777 domain-containing protein n=1 Tax=Streptomyces sp. RerS4 TaxID=2942449 RepID=UPI00201BBA49|nr:DUF6777 domain-containing protein [Streptomyces sp. RerS4]UQX04067.1 hypothetical protein M4D82_28870 [Streptomyces sp. RerS4]
MNDVKDVSAPTHRQTPHRQAPRRHAPACAALFALAGLLTSGCTGSADEPTKGSAAESQEVHLQPVGSPGLDPFTASTATAESAPLQPPVPNASGRGIRTIAAATPGLYGGTNRLGSCDVERQVSLLTTDDAKTQAFAQASGIEQQKLPDFLRGLTPVVLRADTRVTDHAFRAGGPAGYQAVLQAGTAVLVDEHGMPRVRCACGNPIAAPRSAKGSPVLKGEQWSGYQANQVVVIEPTAQVLNHLVIVNTADNTWIERRIGDDGAQDRTPKVVPRFNPADGIPEGPLTPTVPSPSDPCAGTPGRGGPQNSAPQAAPPAPPAGPPKDLPPADVPTAEPPTEVPPGDAPPADLPYEQLPPSEVPYEQLPPGEVPLAGPSSVDVPSTAVPPAAGPPAADAPSGPPAPPTDVPGDVPYEQLPPTDLPSAAVPPAGPPAAELPAAPSTGPSPSAPCPSENAAGNGVPSAPPVAPQRPPGEQPSDVPSDSLGPLPPEDGPVDPSVPLDPYGFDEEPESSDAAQNLESA